MVEALLVIMLIAGVLYTVFAGADFGVGAIESWVADPHRIEVAIAPVWEANHVWLVLLVVLAFVGFPDLYVLTTTYLHIPLLLVLLGIVARGSAFTFRHYDPQPSQLGGLYTALFRWSSWLTPFFLGVIVTTLAGGTMTTAPDASFVDAFVAPWLTPTSVCAGLFVCAFFAFEGASLLASEYAVAGKPLPYLRLAQRAHVASMIAGAATLIVGWTQGARWALGMTRPVSLLALAIATIAIAPVAMAFRKGRPWMLRLSLGVQASAIFVGFFAAQYPVLVHTAEGDVTALSGAAPPATLRVLLMAACIGLVLIVPAMAYLMHVYKGRMTEPR